MATIKVTLPDGTFIEAESGRDIADAVKALSSRTPRTRSTRKPSAIRPQGGSQLTEPAKLLLLALIQTPLGLSTEEAATAAKVGNKSLPPVIRSLSKWCARSNYDLNLLLKRTPEYQDRKPITRYRITDEGKQVWEPLVLNGKVEDERPARSG